MYSFHTRKNVTRGKITHYARAGGDGYWHTLCDLRLKMYSSLEWEFMNEVDCMACLVEEARL